MPLPAAAAPPAAGAAPVGAAGFLPGAGLAPRRAAAASAVSTGDTRQVARRASQAAASTREASRRKGAEWGKGVGYCKKEGGGVVTAHAGPRPARKGRGTRPSSFLLSG